jgi:hypothetical protein
LVRTSIVRELIKPPRARRHNTDQIRLTFVFLQYPLIPLLILMLNGLKQLELYSPIWALCIYAVASITASTLIAIAPFCRVTSQDDGNRFSKIDGLGYLAVGVFHQLGCDHQTVQEFGVWAWPQSSFLRWGRCRFRYRYPCSL